MKKVSKKIIGITGHKGALGTHFINKYKKKVDFRIYKKRIENSKNFKLWVNKNSDIEIFIHLAALSSIKKNERNEKKTHNINTQSSINIINILNNSKLIHFKYFLFASTSHVYKPSFNKLSEKSLRKPRSIYGKSKKKVEDYIFKNKLKLNFRVGIARIFNFYSYKHKEGFFIFDILKRLKNNSALTIKRANTKRDYIQIDQLSEILFFIIKKKIDKPINIGSGKPINLINLVKLIKKNNNLKTKLIFEIKKYPGLFANNKLLRIHGYRKKIRKFILK